MERRTLIQRAGIASILASGVAPAVHAQAAIRWRLASSFPRSLDTMYGAAEVFVRTVRALSNGRFEINVYPAGEVTQAFGVMEGVQAGAVEMCHTVPHYFYDRSPAFALGSAIPFGFNSRQMTAWMTQGNGRRLMNEFYADFGMVSYAGGNTGTQMGGWYLQEIQSPADLKGMKIRLVGGLVGDVMAVLGALPQSLPAGEVYQALQKGTISAAEWVGPYDDQKLGLHKAAPYYYYPGWWEGGAEVDFFINKRVHDQLPAELRAIIHAASAVAHLDMQAKYDALNPTALKQLVAAKTRILPFPAPVLDAAFRASMEVFARNEAQSPEWRRIHGDMRAFQRDQILWFRFAESRYDNYMSAQKI